MAVLLLAALGLYLIGNASVPLMDRDEPRYAQCSRQMLQSGDWVVPRLFDDIRAKKPPLIYWCQASVMRAIGDTAFAARIPSVLAIFACACLLATFVWRTHGPEYALWATLVFCSSALVIVAAKSSTTDAVLLLWIVIGQACVYAIWQGNRAWSVAIILALAIALGLLTKGLIVGVLLATILVLWIFRWIDRRWKSRLSVDLGTSTTAGQLQYSPANDRVPMATRAAVSGKRFAQLLVGLLIVVGIVGPWVYLVHQRSPEFLRAMAHEAAGHAFKGMEGHGGPPGMHLLFIWADMMPWTLLLPAAIALGWIHRDEPATRFALAAVIGPWLMVELAIKTKLPEYMLPTFPPLSFLAGGAIVRGLRGAGPDFSSPQFVGAASIWAGIVVLVGFLPWLAALRFSPLPWAAMVLVSIASILWCVSVISLLRRRPKSLGIAAVGIGMFCVMALFYEQWTPWMVITRDVWNRSPDEVKNHFEIVAHFRGLSVADAMRRLSSQSPVPAAIHPHGGCAA